MNITIPTRRPRRSHHAQTSVTPEEHARLQQIAEKHGISVGGVVYALLRPYLQPTKDPTS